MKRPSITNYVSLKDDSDLKVYLIATTIDSNKLELVKRMYNKRVDQLYYYGQLGDFPCNCEYDSCGCLTSRTVEFITLIGKVYLQITEIYTY